MTPNLIAMPAETSAGDIVQITDEKHPWFPCLLVVSEVKPWGVQACVLIPSSNDGSTRPGQAWNRIKTGQFKKVGVAEYAPA